MDVVFAVAEVQAKRIDACVKQVAQHKRRSACWANCGNDLGSSGTDHGVSFGAGRKEVSANKHSAKIIYIGEGRACLDQVASGVEKTVAVVSRKVVLGGQANPFCPRQNIRPDNGTCCIFCTIDAIGVCRKRMDVGAPVQRDREAEKKFGVPPPPTGLCTAD